MVRLQRLKSELFLIDNDLVGDHRLNNNIDESSQDTVVVDIRNDEAYISLSQAKIFFLATALIFQALWLALPRYRRLSRVLAWRDISTYFRGIFGCIRWLKLSVIASRQMSGDSVLLGVSRVHASNLYCAVAAIYSDFSQQIYLIYDSRELQIHRNRKKGIFRVLIEYGLEQMVLRRVNELRVVNQAVLTQMLQWYEIPTVIRIVYNDYYEYQPISIPSAEIVPGIVYVGKGVQGRKLELLDFPLDELGFEVTVFLLGSQLPNHIDGRNFKSGPYDYVDVLFNLVRERRCLMWCCLETSSLSYKLATPNKFFQALAMGIPIIVSPGSYLAEIVEEHDIGVVFDGLSFLDLASIVSSPVFEKWVENVALFRNKLRNGQVII